MTYLKLATAMFGVVAIVFVMSPSLSVAFFDWMVFGGVSHSPLVDNDARHYAGFIYQVLGAIMFGWVVLLWLAINQKDDTAGSPLWGLRAYAISFAAWYVVDTSMSLVMGYWQNAIFNSGFALAACLPLYLAWSQTKTATAGPSAS